MDEKNNSADVPVMKVCAYLDLLGFKHFVDTDLEGALGLLGNYQTKLFTSFISKKWQASRSAGAGIVKQPIDERGIDSFDYFMPFSDSIFIESSEPNLFVAQLSNFVLGSFFLTSHAFDTLEEEKDPTLVQILKIGTGEYHPAHWFPFMVRAGIAYETCTDVQLTSIVNGSQIQTTTLVGKAVVGAVYLETGLKIKGPRLLCTPEFYMALDPKVQKRLTEVEEDRKYYEILWPACGFLDGDTVDSGLINHFENVFRPAARLWRFYQDPKANIHYLNFIKLIIKSTLRHFSYDPNALAESRRYIVKRLQMEQLYDTLEDTANNFQ